MLVPPDHVGLQVQMGLKENVVNEVCVDQLVLQDPKENVDLQELVDYLD